MNINELKSTIESAMNLFFRSGQSRSYVINQALGFVNIYYMSNTIDDSVFFELTDYVYKFADTLWR